MNITKKVCIYILVGLITITGTFTSFYKGAYAFEYVGGALGFEEAIKWLLASVGIISAGGMTADYWEQHGQEFKDYCTQQNITDTEVANWQLKLCEGVLDKGSECWQAFKEWASTLTSSNGNSTSPDDNVVSGEVIFSVPFGSSCDDVVTIINSYYHTSVTLPNNNSVVKSFFLIYLNNSIYSIYLFTADGSYSINNKVVTNSNSNYSGIQFRNGWTSISNSWGINPNFVTNYGYFAFSDNWSIINTDFGNSLKVIDFVGSSVIDSDFISVQKDVTDLDIISSPIPDTDAQEVAIPMPGVSDSDNEASASAYDDIIDAVNNGQIELDDAITQIQDILKIIVYEEETEKIFPKPDNEEDQEDLDDKINQNKNNMGFTLGGLENVFPFCIPWDIYAFMSLLRAEPVPPKVELPFPNPLKPNEPWTVEVDFADWDDGMKIVRLAEDFLFIIGLAVLTRSLIGAGGGDG